MAQGPDDVPRSGQAVSQYVLQYGMKKAVRAIPDVRRGAEWPAALAGELCRGAGFERAASSPRDPLCLDELVVQLRFAVCSPAVSTLRNRYSCAAETLVVGTDE
jgi:hypothetical protein